MMIIFQLSISPLLKRYKSFGRQFMCVPWNRIEALLCLELLLNPHIPFCFRSLYGSGRSRDWWPGYGDRCRCWATEGDHRGPAEPCLGAGWVELPEASLPDHRVWKPWGPAAHGGEELRQAAVEQPGALWQLGYLKHGPAEHYWALQGKFIFKI